MGKAEGEEKKIELTALAASCGRFQYTYSRRLYKIRPIPNDGSITFGVYSRVICTRVSCLMVRRSCESLTDVVPSANGVDVSNRHYTFITEFFFKHL